jgi:hypothetical protein
MTENTYNRMTVTQNIQGVESTVNTEPGEIYIDIPATNPRYIHVREGDYIMEGDIRSRRREELESPALRKWRIKSISEDTVVGVDAETGEFHDWSREWLVNHLAVGEYSVELRDFGQVSVTATWDCADVDEGVDDTTPMVIATIYGNDGEQFTRQYTASRSGDWDSLTLASQDPRVDTFDKELRERFNNAVTTALEIERRYS